MSVKTKVTVPVGSSGRTTGSSNSNARQDTGLRNCVQRFLRAAGVVLEAAGHPREAAAAMGGAAVVRAEISAPWPPFEA
jgi:hypothetical protein